MTDSERLVLLKADLEIIPANTSKDEYLSKLLTAADEYIATEGIELTDSVGDAQLAVMYAAYLYRKRAVNEPMPRMLRYALNNRLFAQKMGGG